MPKKNKNLNATPGDIIPEPKYSAFTMMQLASRCNRHAKIGFLSCLYGMFGMMGANYWVPEIYRLLALGVYPAMIIIIIWAALKKDRADRYQKCAEDLSDKFINKSKQGKSK